MNKRQIPWDLITSRLEGDILPEDNVKLRAWLADEKHQQLYKEIEALWKEVQQRTKEYAPQPALYWEQVAQKLQLPSTRQKQHTTHIHISNLYKIAACVALLMVASLSFYIGVHWDTRKNVWEQCYTNLTGKSQVMLPDGTLVWLHSDTRLAYKTDFKKKTRQVELEGEAYFEVSKDPKSRFVVHTNGMDITVYGTKFNVMAHADKEDINVSLLEGSVAFTTAGKHQEQFLQPGEKVIYNKTNHQSRIYKENVAMNAAWATPVVQFSNCTLQEICEVLSHRFDVQILIDSNVNKQRQYTFTLHDENVSEILELISLIHPIQYTFVSNKEIRIHQ